MQQKEPSELEIALCHSLAPCREGLVDSSSTVGIAAPKNNLSATNQLSKTHAISAAGVPEAIHETLSSNTFKTEPNRYRYKQLPTRPHQAKNVGPDKKSNRAKTALVLREERLAGAAVVKVHAMG